MLKAKRGIFLQLKWNISSIFSILEVGDEPKTFSHHLVMQHFEVYLHFYKFNYSDLHKTSRFD